jgi:membrane protein required for colicin V production
MIASIISVNWFDFVVLATIAAGVYVGRRRGMSSELLDLIQWLLIIFLGALFCEPFGRALVDLIGFPAVSCFILAYLLIALVIKIGFLLIKRWSGEKLISGDSFGATEYYLGMFAGAVRFGCILLFALALMHAQPVNEEELKTKRKTQIEDLGSIYFPPFGDIQKSIFEESVMGRLVKENMASQLINVDTQLARNSRDNIGQMRMRDVNDIIDRKR